ncbi:MAG: T9SS type A sorting domain-containing protein [bacterium]|nr:T9SS type A sorting domain-containing protein [bacterium]
MKKQSFMWVVSLLIAGSAGVAKADKNVWAWGDNYWGQLGDSTNNDRYQPVKTKFLNNIFAVSAGGGYDHSLAINSDSTVWAWGDNSFGQLGIGSSDYNSHTVPEQTLDLTNVIAISAGNGHSLALKSDGTVWGWGANYYGQLGDSTTIYGRSQPVQTKRLTDAIAISATGAFHSLALIKSDSTVWAWGNNPCGQLGIGSSDYNTHTVPVRTNLLTNVIAIAAGQYHSLALRSDGTVWAWGGNYSGQIGDSTTANRNQPVKVKILTEVIAIAAGSEHSLALKSDGTVWAWGDNSWGQLGIGSSDYNSHTVPEQTLGLTDVIAISAGNEHSLALIRSDSTVWAWGHNYSGELGIGTSDYSPHTTPVQTSLLTGVTAISAGWGYSLALKYVPVGVEEPLISVPLRLRRIASLQLLKGKICLSVPNDYYPNALITIYNLCGRMQSVVFSGTLSKGNYTFTPNIKKNGIYFVRLKTNNFTETKKLILIK